MTEKIKGVKSKSQIVFCTSSPFANKNLYCPVCAGHFDCTHGYNVNRKNYDNILIMHIVSGECFINLKGNDFVAKSGDTVVVDCNSHHKYYCTDNMETVWIHVKGVNSTTLSKVLTNNESSPVIIGTGSKTSELIIKCLDEMSTPNNMNEVKMSLNIYAIFTHLLSTDNNSLTSKNDYIIDTAKEYIISNLEEDLTVDTIANAVHLSTSYFSKIFKESVGFSPYNFVLISRLNKAKDYLINTDRQISEISRLTGFNSEANFIYFFTKNTGISPGKFRRLNF